MEIRIRDDFDLQKIHESGQCFRWEQPEVGVWRIPHRDACLYIRSLGDERYALDCTETEFREIWHGYFDLDTDYALLRRRLDDLPDPFLRRAAEAGAGIRILHQDPWEALVSFIISQNRNIPGIRSSIRLLCRAAGAERRDARGMTWHAFPGPGEIRRLGLSGLDACRLGYRSPYVLGAAEAVLSGGLDLDALQRAEPDRVLAALTALKGVGPKVAACAALFGLHQLDAFPVDVWIRRALEAEYPDGFPRERCSPYNGVYQQYIFAYIRSLSRPTEKGDPHA